MKSLFNFLILIVFLLNSNLLFAQNWKQIGPKFHCVNITSENNEYYIRAMNDVYKATSLYGPWSSLNFFKQVGIEYAGKMLGLDWKNRLIVATPNEDIYAYDNGYWVSLGLSGYGCGGNFIQRLKNGRIILMKGGFLRDLYISDNNGANWKNVTNVDNDYHDIVVSKNGTIYVCGGDNTEYMAGLISSNDNGNSFKQINSLIGNSYCTGLALGETGDIFAVIGDKIYTSKNDITWNQICTFPISSNENIIWSNLLVFEKSFYLLLKTNDKKFFLKSSDYGKTWDKIKNLPIDESEINDISKIDNNVVLISEKGIFIAKPYVYVNPDEISNIENKMQEEIKQIKPQDEFEPQSVYKSRLDYEIKRIKVKYDNILDTLEESAKYIINKKIKDSYTQVELKIFELSKYDPDNEEFKLIIKEINSDKSTTDWMVDSGYSLEAFDTKLFTLKIPIDEARTFKSNYLNAKITASKQLNINATNNEIFNIKVKHPVSGKTYEIGKQRAPLYIDNLKFK
jgi:hypothetical protein